MRIKIAASFTAAAAAVVVLAGCSDDTSSGSSMDGHSMGSSSASSAPSERSESASAQFNGADVMFATMMYPHHAQAVEMADMVAGRTDNPEITSLAADISAAQQPEMEQLTAWLAEWGQPAPSADMSRMGSMDHSSGNGMMTQQDMDSLMAASGADLDRQWLTMMIAHHTGAVEMASTEMADGSDPDAKELARTIVATQNQQIDTMRGLLA